MFINPYGEKPNFGDQWFKANFHTHAGTGKDTCGAYEIDDVVSLYKEAGYGILAITNHDVFTDTAEYESRHDIIMINSFEHSVDPATSLTTAFRHMVCIGVESVNKGIHQEVINEGNRQGGFTILCHPNWIHKENWPSAEVDALKGYAGIEIYNGVIPRLSGCALAEDMWDYLLSQGKIVWGFANDDFHRWFDLARGWNVIHAPSKNQEDIIASIKGGKFYTSTGLILKEFALENNRLTVQVTTKDTYIENYNYTFIGKDGHILAEQTGETGVYDLGGDELYVRVKAGNEYGAMLWSQPIYRKDLFYKV
jgi:hypothetical protein